MWHREFRDYKTDTSLVKYKVEPGKGIYGCEMHDINGWGEQHHIPKRKSNLFTKLLSYFFGTEKESL